MEGFEFPGKMFDFSAALLDHFVGAVENRERDCQTERLGGLEIDDQFDFRGLLDRPQQILPLPARFSSAFRHPRWSGSQESQSTLPSEPSRARPQTVSRSTYQPKKSRR